MTNVLIVLQESFAKLKRLIHDNIYMIIGFYGISVIMLLCLLAEYNFDTQLHAIFPHSLPPAWKYMGDINHILGTDTTGQDIFGYFLVAYQTSMLMALKTIIGVIIIGVILNYLLFFVAPLRMVVNVIFKTIISIPPLLSAIVITLLLKDNLSHILFIVGLAYLPKLVYNVHEKVMQEYKKTYITAARLDGLPTSKLLNFYIIPNILPTYLNEVITLFGHVLLVLTSLTFLGFANNMIQPDLGIMMYNMLTIIKTNYWAFLIPGFAIIITIVVINLFNIGLSTILNKRSGN